ncbi:MAG: hypothetical protein ACHQWH_04345 [Nitrososphaerales archaeon]
MVFFPHYYAFGKKLMQSWLKNKTGSPFKVRIVFPRFPSANVQHCNTIIKLLFLKTNGFVMQVPKFPLFQAGEDSNGGKEASKGNSQFEAIILPSYFSALH